MVAQDPLQCFCYTGFHNGGILAVPLGVRCGAFGDARGGALTEGVVALAGGMGRCFCVERNMLPHSCAADALTADACQPGGSPRSLLV
jgi:hypothetical protein